MNEGGSRAVAKSSRHRTPTALCLRFYSTLLSKNKACMPPPLSRLLHTLHPVFPSSAPMARVFSRATSLPLSNPLLTTAFSSIHSSSSLSFTPKFNRFRVLWLSKHSAFGKNFHALSGEGDGRLLRPTGGRVWAAQRGYRKVRRRAVPKIKEKGLELNVSICIEEKLPDDPEILVNSQFVYLRLLE